MHGDDLGGDDLGGVDPGGDDLGATNGGDDLGNKCKQRILILWCTYDQLLYLVARFCIVGEIIVPFDDFDEDAKIVMMMTFELLMMMMMVVMMIRVLRRLDWRTGASNKLADLA